MKTLLDRNREKLREKSSWQILKLGRFDWIKDYTPTTRIFASCSQVLSEFTIEDRTEVGCIGNSLYHYHTSFRTFQFIEIIYSLIKDGKQSRDYINIQCSWYQKKSTRIICSLFSINWYDSFWCLHLRCTMENRESQKK